MSENIRQETVKELAVGIVNALTNINGGLTHCNIRDWLFWQGSLSEAELNELYKLILERTIEVYSKTDMPFTGDRLNVSAKYEFWDVEQTQSSFNRTC